MISQVSIDNSESTVYTVPTGKSAMIFVEVNPTSTEPTCTIKINNMVYWTGVLYGFLSSKISLTEGDVVKVSSDGQVNVFVHGILV